MNAPAPYAAVAMQLTAQAIDGCHDRSDVSAHVLRMIGEVEAKVRSAAIFIEQYGGVPVKLVVLPEYLFTSYPGRIGLTDWARLAAFAPDGPDYAALGALAERLQVHLAVNAYETDAHFPDLYFQASVILSPAGEAVLRYRRLNSMFAPTPHDVWSRYLDIYGEAGVFPVADTPLGRLAAIASEEILYPEIARAHALRGAEVFVHSSSEIGSPHATPKAVGRRARAFENMAWIVSANTAGIAGTALPLASADGNSQVLDWRGKVLAESNSGETFTAFATVDLAASRRARATPAMTNMLARQRLEPFAATYARSVAPPDTMADGPPERAHFRRVQEQTIERLTKDGLI